MGEKRYKGMSGVGKAKYVVNYHDGEKKHEDGSDFYDISIFKNKKDANKFVKQLDDEGYKGNGIFDSADYDYKEKTEVVLSLNRLAFEDEYDAYLSDEGYDEGYGNDKSEMFDVLTNHFQDVLYEKKDIIGSSLVEVNYDEIIISFAVTDEVLVKEILPDLLQMGSDAFYDGLPENVEVDNVNVREFLNYNGLLSCRGYEMFMSMAYEFFNLYIYEPSDEVLDAIGKPW